MDSQRDPPTKQQASSGVTVKPVVNAVRILRHLSETDTPERAADIARNLSINPSTCFNILRTLVGEEMLEFNASSKTYKPGLGLARLVGNLVTQGQRLDVARPLMQKFAAHYRVTVTLWRQMGDKHIVLVSSEASPTDLRIDMAVGQRLPLLMGASGRLFAAEKNLAETEMKAIFDRIRWARPLEFGDYVAQVRHAREHGWAMDDGYFSAGILAIAAPIRDRSRAVAFTVSAVMFRGQYQGDEAARLGSDIRTLADQLSSLLF